MYEPLQVIAQLRESIALRRGYLHLDALLAAIVAQRIGAPPPEVELVELKIPIELSPCGRFHLASAAVADWELMLPSWTTKRYPLEEMQIRGPRNARINLSAGPQKHWRIPYDRGLVRDDRLSFVCRGERTAIEDLLESVHYLGAKRGSGHGRLASWVVEPCETWAGFPVLSPDGNPLRHLPADHPGLSPEAPRTMGRVTFPYWSRMDEQEVALPA